MGDEKSMKEKGKGKRKKQRQQSTASTSSSTSTADVIVTTAAITTTTSVSSATSSGLPTTKTGAIPKKADVTVPLTSIVSEGAGTTVEEVRTIPEKADKPVPTTSITPKKEDLTLKSTGAVSKKTDSTVPTTSVVPKDADITVEEASAIPRKADIPVPTTSLSPKGGDLTPKATGAVSKRTDKTVPTTSNPKEASLTGKSTGAIPKRTHATTPTTSINPKEADLTVKSTGAIPKRPNVTFSEAAIAAKEGDSKLKKTDETPKKSDVAAPATGLFPNLAELLVKVKGVIPKRTNVTVPAPGIIPKVTDLTGKSTGAIPKRSGTSITPKGADLTVRSTGAIPKRSNLTLPTTSITPKGADLTVQSKGAKSKKSKTTAPTTSITPEGADVSNLLRSSGPTRSIHFTQTELYLKIAKLKLTLSDPIDISMVLTKTSIHRFDSRSDPGIIDYDAYSLDIDADRAFCLSSVLNRAAPQATEAASTEAANREMPSTAQYSEACSSNTADQVYELPRATETANTETENRGMLSTDLYSQPSSSNAPDQILKPRQPTETANTESENRKMAATAEYSEASSSNARVHLDELKEWRRTFEARKMPSSALYSEACASNAPGQLYEFEVLPELHQQPEFYEYAEVYEYLDIPVLDEDQVLPAPKESVFPELNRELLLISPEPQLLPEPVIEEEEEAAEVPGRRRTLSENRYFELQAEIAQSKQSAPKRERRRTSSENNEGECNTKLLLFNIKDRESNKTVFLQVPRLVFQQASFDNPETNSSRENLIEPSEEIVEVSHDPREGATSLDFDSLPILRDVRIRATTCEICGKIKKKEYKGFKKYWKPCADWCTNSNMKCACMDTSRYDRVANVGGYMALLGAEDKDDSNEKQEELVFHNDDGSYQSVVVERNLCASDLCQLLALKNRVTKDVSWSIVQYWINLGLERILEDHEDVLSAHRDMENFDRTAEVKFIFRKDHRKYEFFQHPQQFFPPDMIDIENCISMGNSELFTSNIGNLMNLVTRDGECPSVFSNVWILQDLNRQIWSKGFLLLRDKKLYLSYKVQVVAKFLRSGKQKDSTYYPVSEAEAGQLTVFARLSEYEVYTTLNAKNQFRAPTEWGICLRPTGVDTDPTANQDDDVDFAGSSGASLRCLACDSERARTCWLTAMRLAKYGKQLRENYRAFKNKQVESINPKDYNSYTVPNESVRSRVAMDFTGSVGRIVEDPKEAKAIATAEGIAWRRRWRGPSRTHGPHYSSLTLEGMEAGVHLTQPWFHNGMSRDRAAALVLRYGDVNGVFLVRDSRSNPGSFVLTYKNNGKVLHTQITPILDSARDTPVFSLDNGYTRFYDLLQLVEFYQLNAGVLSTRLTHYVVQTGTGINVPASNMSPTVSGSL